MFAIVTGVIGVIGGALFLSIPTIDPMITSWAYSEGFGFPAARWPGIRQVSEVVELVAWTIGIGLAVMLVWKWLRRDDRLPSYRVLAYLLATLLMGPVVLVNGVFKENWGRARPEQTVEFGGDKAFSPALVISDQCRSNCSFVTGDGSVGFYLVAFGLAFPRHRRAWIAAGLFAGSAIGAARVIGGNHYVSDVFFAGVFICLTAWVLYQLIVRSEHIRSAAPT